MGFESNYKEYSGIYDTKSNKLILKNEQITNVVLDTYALQYFFPLIYGLRYIPAYLRYYNNKKLPEKALKSMCTSYIYNTYTIPSVPYESVFEISNKTKATQTYE